MSRILPYCISNCILIDMRMCICCQISTVNFSYAPIITIESPYNSLIYCYAFDSEMLHGIPDPLISTKVFCLIVLFRSVYNAQRTLNAVCPTFDKSFEG